MTSFVKNPDFKIQRWYPKRVSVDLEIVAHWPQMSTTTTTIAVKKGSLTCSEEENYKNYKAQNYSMIISLTCPIVFFCEFSSQLKEQLAELREKLSRTESESTVSVSKLQDVIQGLKERLKALEKEKERALRTRRI